MHTIPNRSPDKNPCAPQSDRLEGADSETPPAVVLVSWLPVAPLDPDARSVSDIGTRPADLEALARFIREDDATANTTDTDCLLQVVCTAAGPVGAHYELLAHNGLFAFRHSQTMDVMPISRLRGIIVPLPGCALVSQLQPDGVWSLFVGPLAWNDAEYRRHWAAILDTFPDELRRHTAAECAGLYERIAIGHDGDVWLADAMPEAQPGAGLLEAEPEALAEAAAPAGPQPEPSLPDTQDFPPAVEAAPPAIAVVMNGVIGKILRVSDLVEWADLSDLIRNGRNDLHRERSALAREARGKRDLVKAQTQDEIDSARADLDAAKDALKAAKAQVGSINPAADPDGHAEAVSAYDAAGAALKAASAPLKACDDLYSNLKKGLPSAILASSNPPGSAVASMDPTACPSEIYGYDVDEGSETMDKNGVRGALRQIPGICMIGESAGGDLWCGVRGPVIESTGDVAADLKAWTRQWHFMRLSMPDGARISTAQGSSNFNRFRFLCHDPTFWAEWPDVAHPPAPAGWELPPPQEQPTGRRQARQKPPAGSPGAYAPAGDLGDLDLIPAAAGDLGDLDLVQDAMEFIPCPKEGNGVGRDYWLNLLGDLTALGISDTEISAWCETGNGTTCGDLGEVQKGLRQRKQRNPLEALDNILGAAWNHGWRPPADRKRRRAARAAPNVLFDAFDPDTVDNPGCVPLDVDEEPFNSDDEHWTEPPEPPRRVNVGPKPGDTGGERPPATLDEALDAAPYIDLSAMPRNVWLGWMGIFKQGGFTLEQCQALSNASAQAIGTGELGKIWAGMPHDASKTAEDERGKICGTAFTAGWRKSSGRPQDAQDGGPKAKNDRQKDQKPTEGEKQPTSARLVTISMAELLETPETDWLIPGLLAKASTNLLYGPPKSGKTFFMLAMLRAAADGGEFLGQYLTAAGGLLLSEQAPSSLSPQARMMGFSPDSHVRVAPRFHQAHYEDSAALAEMIYEYWTGCRDESPGLVVIDTLASFVRMDDANDYSSVKRSLEPLTQVGQLMGKRGTATMLTYHDRKSGGEGSDSVLGSRAMSAEFDSLIRIGHSPGGNDRRRLTIQSRYGTGALGDRFDVVLDLATGVYSLKEDAADNEALVAEILVVMAEIGDDDGWAAKREINAELAGSHPEAAEDSDAWKSQLSRAIRGMVQDKRLENNGRKSQALRYRIPTTG